MAVESRGLRGYEMQKRSPPPFGFSLPPSLPPLFRRLSRTLSRSVLFEVPRAARGPKNGPSKKCKRRVPSGPSWPLFVRGGRGWNERARTWTNHRRVRSGRDEEEKRNNEPSRTRERWSEPGHREKRDEGQKEKRERERERMNARCLQGANKNSNRTFRSSPMLLLDLLSLRP